MAENKSTLLISNPGILARLDLVVVVDDVLTTGSSFRAMGEFLRENGFRGGSSISPMLGLLRARS